MLRHSNRTRSENIFDTVCVILISIQKIYSMSCCKASLLIQKLNWRSVECSSRWLDFLGTMHCCCLQRIIHISAHKINGIKSHLIAKLVNRKEVQSHDILPPFRKYKNCGETLRQVSLQEFFLWLVWFVTYSLFVLY